MLKVVNNIKLNLMTLIMKDFFLDFVLNDVNKYDISIYYNFTCFILIDERKMY